MALLLVSTVGAEILAEGYESLHTTVEQSGPNGAKTNSVSQKLQHGRREVPPNDQEEG